MLRSFISFMAVTILAPFALGESAMARPPLRRTEKIVVRDTVRVPYLAGKVYEVRLMPGAPFALELPTGESARNIWVDNRWWKAESTPGSSRGFLRALGTDDVVDAGLFLHFIERLARLDREGFMGRSYRIAGLRELFKAIGAEGR